MQLLAMPKSTGNDLFVHKKFKLNYSLHTTLLHPKWLLLFLIHEWMKIKLLFLFSQQYKVIYGDWVKNGVNQTN